MAIFPLAPDQTIAQMWSNGVRGGVCTTTARICWHVTTLDTYSSYSLCEAFDTYNWDLFLFTLCNASDTLKKLPETCASRLVQETCTCVVQSGSYWYQFLARNRTQLYFCTETVWYVTQTMQPDWLASCFCERNCDELVLNFSCKFLVQVSWAYVAGKVVHHSWNVFAVV